MIDARLISWNAFQVDLAIAAEIRAGRARRGIDGNESRIERRFEQAAAARCPALHLRIEPRGDPAIDQAVAIIRIGVDFRVGTANARFPYPDRPP